MTNATKTTKTKKPSKKAWDATVTRMADELKAKGYKFQPKGYKFQPNKKPVPPTIKAKPAEVTELPKATASVVGQHWKTKAGKAGVWKSDKLNDAVRNAFLAESGTNVDAQAAARIATDTILTENGLDSGRWAGKNAGMLSMNLRNVLRGLIRNDGLCMVYGKKIS